MKFQIMAQNIVFSIVYKPKTSKFLYQCGLLQILWDGLVFYISQPTQTVHVGFLGGSYSKGARREEESAERMKTLDFRLLHERSRERRST